MKTKREYMPANIRAGYTAQKAAKVITDNQEYITGYKQWCVVIETFDHGRDVNGNGTAHYTCHLVGGAPEDNNNYTLCIVESGKRREQVGYSGQNEVALMHRLNSKAVQ